MSQTLVQFLDQLIENNLFTIAAVQNTSQNSSKKELKLNLIQDKETDNI